MGQIRALGADARHETRAAARRGTDAREPSATMSRVSQDLHAIRGAINERPAKVDSPVEDEASRTAGAHVNSSDITPPSV